MAELADAHGSGPCESNFMQVQVLLSAPKKSFGNPKLFCFYIKFSASRSQMSDAASEGIDKSPLGERPTLFLKIRPK